MKKLLMYSLSMLMGALGANAQQLDATPIPTSSVQKMITTLEAKYGQDESFRIRRGVEQTAMLWRASDGSVANFEQFVADGYEADAAKLDALFNKLSRAFEIMNGYNLRMTMDLKKPLDLDWGPVEPIDEIVGSFNPFAHLADDLYANKMAFMVSLNFPTYSLAEKTQLGPKWSRKQWAYARIAADFRSLVLG